MYRLIMIAGLLGAFGARGAVFEVPASDVEALGQAILDANANAEPDIIHLVGGSAYRVGGSRFESCGAGSHLPPIEGRVIIEGHGAVIDGRNADTQLLCITEAADVTIRNVHITRFDVLEYALNGIVTNNGSLNMASVSVSDSTARAHGNFGGPIPRPTIDNNGVMSLRNLTVTRSGGAAVGNSGIMTMINATIAGNSGFGLFYGGQELRVINSIIADNGERDCSVSVLTSLGHNLDSDGSCGFSQPTDMPDTNARLGSFGDHGGGVPTVALRADSPAIGAGDPESCSLLDGRGHVRASGPDWDCDIGAFERDARTDAVDAALTATWFDVREDGHFFNVQVLGGNREQVLVHWNTFDAEGNALWLQGVGGIQGHRVDLVLYEYGGMRYPSFDPAERTYEPWGTLTLAFPSCWRAVALYEPLDASLPAADSRLIRLTNTAGLSCR